MMILTKMELVLIKKTKKTLQRALLNTNFLLIGMANYEQVNRQAFLTIVLKHYLIN